MEIIGIFFSITYLQGLKNKIPKNIYGIRRHQIFLEGSSDENEKVLGKFLARLRRAKYGVPKFYACGGLKTVKKSLKPLKKILNFQKLSKNRQIFDKRDPKIPTDSADFPIINKSLASGLVSLWQFYIPFHSRFFKMHLFLKKITIFQILFCTYT